MRIVVTRDLDQFADRVEAFLAEELERNVLATVLMNARAGAFAGGGPPATAAYALDGHDRICAAALRTPPWPLLTTGFDTPEVAVELAGAWLEVDPCVDMVNGPPRSARAIADALATRSGRRAQLRMSEAMHVLEKVSALPYEASGHLRAAEEIERALLIEWERAFIAEARLGDGDRAEGVIDRRLVAGSQYLWDDGGPVSTACAHVAVAGTVRIGPVYTPPEKRGRGYATCAVAALSERVLAGGAERCMLFTDLANPTSNKIYALVGYRRIGDWEEHELTR